MDRATLHTLLRRHPAADDTEAAHIARTEDFLTRTADPFSRTNLARGADGHITGSAFVVDAGRGKALLLWHAKLSRWLQPGGHCEPETDETVLATAWRELREETGEVADGCRTFSDAPFDVDVHKIPARGEEPAHLHYDVRFLFVADAPAEPPEGVRWVSLAEVAALPDPSLSRMARKVLNTR